MFKVNNKLIRFGIFIVKFEHTQDLALVFLLLPLGR